MEWPADRVARRPVAELAPYAKNARTHSDAQVAQIADSIAQWGFTNPVLVDEAGTLIAGHGRVLAAQKMGLADVPTMTATGWSAAQVQAYRIADNKMALLAGWDDEALAFEFGELQAEGFDLALTGFGEDEIASLFAKHTEGLTDPDDAPEPPAVPTSVLGDVWLLGRHRLVCGDCMDVLPTLAGIDAVVADPPYGMGWDTTQPFTGGKNGHRRDGDRRPNWENVIGDDKPFNPAPFLGFPHVVLWGCNHFGQRLPVGTTLVWIKRFDDAFGSFLSDAEVAWVKGNHGVYCQRDTSLNATTNERHHPTEKPVAIMRWSIERAGGEGTILDPFAGSGTTIIAAEMTGRACHAIELSPAYVDVAVLRWQAFTGQTATHAETGEPFKATNGA